MTLAHLQTGDHGRPLLILHGLFGSGRNWGAIAKRLAQSYRVYALDLPNHGRSDWATDPVTYPMMAETVRQWMDSQNLESALVLGHSMGGKTAMQLALNHGDRVDALMVIDIAPYAYTGREHLSYIQAMQGVDLTRFSRRSEVEAELTDAIPLDAIRKFLMQNLVLNETTGHLEWQINLAGLAASMANLMDFPLEPDMEPYGGPTFFLAGGASDYVRPEAAPAMQRLFLDHSLVTMDGCGHWPHAEQPGPFTEHLLTFLASEARS